MLATLMKAASGELPRPGLSAAQAGRVDEGDTSEPV